MVVSAQGRNRTSDTGFFRPVLCQLSYLGGSVRIPDTLRPEVSTVIEIDGLRKEYFRLRGGRTLAVRGLDLSVPEGGVFGFLGPNGSGKTTTIRCLLGLIRPTGGSTRVLGADPLHDLWRVSGRIGSIVETPALFPTFSGRENLALMAKLAGLGAVEVSQALERVGLADRAKDLVKHYSLGMKQRLGLAAALLKDPALRILDEPANGLDPSGIKEVRDLLRGLGAEGRTVFVSSHQLQEVQYICSRVAILSRGQCAVRFLSRDLGPADLGGVRSSAARVPLRHHHPRDRTQLGAVGVHGEPHALHVRAERLVRGQVGERCGDPLGDLRGRGFHADIAGIQAPRRRLTSAHRPDGAREPV